jgi:hypothetical protein
MPVKKSPRTKKPARGKRPMGLTSALGSKATTMVVIVTIAAGIMIAARQQQAKAKDRTDAARTDVVLSGEPEVNAKKKPAASSAAATAPASTPASAPAATGTAGSANAKPVTVTGCLERTDAGYRLSETTGADAPKARSWKSGFLKKSSATLDVVDPSRALPLADHVGRRVSVTGALVDRDLQARSVRRVGACKSE